MSHRGSLEYWPHRRAQRLLPRVRNWPTPAEPSVLSLVAFKAGMTHIGMIDDSQSPTKGQEITRAATVVVFPKMFVYGARLYKKSYLYRQPATEVYDAAMAEKVGIKKVKSGNVEEAKKKAGEYDEVTALAFADPTPLGIGIKKMIRFEFPVGGKDTASKIAFIEKAIGKEIKPSEVLANGDFIDIIGISMGKGWEGPIHRFGASRQYHKATGKRRHISPLGAFSPGKVLFSVPQAGHLGFNYRTEINKRVLKIGTIQDAASVTPNGGFLNFGTIKNDYLLLAGSVVGPAKRLLRIRKALRASRKPVAPKITYISLESKQGA
ncbi:MAG: 50S ribosomal protein L3 [Candidatus Micrarchaeota archaeon]|nr:50S ribosomal protein L3 [Candidatus Micrarchaeota archaeon]